MNSKFPPTSCCIFSRHIPRNSTRRKICGTKFGKNSLKTTLLNPWTKSTQNLKRPPSTSNATQHSSNPSPHSPTSPGQSDMEAVSHATTERVDDCDDLYATLEHIASAPRES